MRTSYNIKVGGTFMKILTICIPYGEEKDNLKETLESCLMEDENIEILIIGKSNKLIESYQSLYPDIIRVYQNEEELIKTGIQHATGLYFKVVKAGDTLDKEVLYKVMKTIQDFIRIQVNLDMIICNYSYPINHKKSKTIDFYKTLPTQKVIGWHEFKLLKRYQNYMLPALIFKTKILKNLDLISDQIVEYSLAYLPFIHVKAIYYMRKNLYYCHDYHQLPSDDQLLQYKEDLCKTVSNMIDGINIEILKSRKQRHYLSNYLLMILSNASKLCIYLKDDETKDALWKQLQEKNPIVYRHASHSIKMKSIQSQNKYLNQWMISSMKHKRN